MSPEFYPRGTVDFSQPGQPLKDAYNIVVNERVSAAWTLSFDIPINSPYRDTLVENTIVKAAGQLFLISVVTEGINEGQPYVKISGIHLFWERCSKIHLPRTMWIGFPADEILSLAFKNIFYGGNQIRMLTAEELAPLGMEPVTALTDIYRDRVTPLEVASGIRDHVGGEFYVDNFTFALVKRQGVDTNEVYNLNIQTSSIERTIDNGNTFTRLYPYGRGNLEITSVHGQNFIDSPLIGADPDFANGRQGQKDFSDFTNAADLLRAAQWQFSHDNYWRIDRPRVTYNLSAVDLWKLNPENHLRLKMGDSIRLVDPNLKIDDQVRVVAMEVYPYESRSTVYTLGDPPRTHVDILSAVDPANSFYNSQTFNFNLDELAADIIEKIPEIAPNFGRVPILRRIPKKGDMPTENIPDGIYEELFLARIELFNKEDWRQMIREGKQDRTGGVFYGFAASDEFEKTNKAMIEAVLAEHGIGV
ncbi:MAG: phage tail protein [Defluviitaleaceae bacterium]|nr:phage tail protein [Defluviitaleaceae bacterium]